MKLTTGGQKSGTVTRKNKDHAGKMPNTLIKKKNVIIDIKMLQKLALQFAAGFYRCMGKYKVAMVYLLGPTSYLKKFQMVVFNLFV